MIGFNRHDDDQVAQDLSDLGIAADDILQALAEAKNPGTCRRKLGEADVAQLVNDLKAQARAIRAKSEADRKRNARHTKGINKGMR